MQSETGSESRESDVSENILMLEENGRDIESDMSDRMFLSTDSDSIPRLTPSEESSSDETTETDQDSGVSDRNVGNVTNLCRRRLPQTVEAGVVTETGPFIPVTLGFGGSDDDNDCWEEVLDDFGNPTGMERLSFRLNVRDLRTESIDEELDQIRRMNGLNDGTNRRWYSDDIES